MSEIDGNNLSKVKLTNQSAIRRVIYHQGPISRQEIARQLSLTLPTITTNVAKMISLGLLKEVDNNTRSAGTLGRKTQLIEVVDNARHFMGIEMRGSLRRIVVTTYRGNIIACCGDDTFCNDYDELISKTAVLAKQLLQSINFSVNQLSGIGVGMPGLINEQDSTLLIHPEYHWKNKRVCDDLQAALGYSGPMALENNACARTYGTYLFHKDRLKDHTYFAYLLVAAGIAYPLMNTQIQSMRPIIGIGEIGHMVMNPSGPLCRCGNHGCLEAYASETAVLAQCSEAVAQGRAPILKGLCADSPMTIDHVLQAQAQGDAQVCRIVDTAIDRLGIAIANIQNFVDAQQTFVECRYFESKENQEKLLSVVNPNLYRNGQIDLDIVFLPRDEYSGASGAAAIAVYHDLRTYVE